MATQKKNQKENAQESFKGEYTFVNLSLTDEQQERAAIVYEDINLVWDTVVGMMRDGYKVSLSYDERSDSFCCTLSGVRCVRSNLGKCLTGWADNEYDAMRFALFKHTTVLEMNWGSAGSKDRRRG